MDKLTQQTDKKTALWPHRGLVELLNLTHQSDVTQSHYQNL
jgi:hypothetical protein